VDVVVANDSSIEKKFICRLRDIGKKYCCHGITDNFVSAHKAELDESAVAYDKT